MVLISSFSAEYEADTVVTMKAMVLYPTDIAELFCYLRRKKNFSAPKVPSNGTYIMRNLM